MSAVLTMRLVLDDGREATADLPLSAEEFDGHDQSAVLTMLEPMYAVCAMRLGAKWACKQALSE